jgi:DNA-binding NarL/FixJ family response regulator
VKPIRLVLADDHQLVRAGFRALLQQVPGVEVVAEAADGQETIECVEKQRPDVVMMDITMKRLNGLQAAARINKQFPGTRVIIVSVHATEEYVVEALRAGAAGYLIKDAAPDELARAIQAVAGGEIYLSPSVSSRVSDYIKRQRKDVSPLERLTPRQYEILQLIAEGHTTKEIARLLHISIKTVETHKGQLMEALDIHDVAGLVRYAVHKGLVESE